MRAATFFLALSAVVASVSAATTLHRRQYPDCAQPCIANAQTGSCFSDDLNCLCKSSDFINSTTSCIVSSCDAADTLAAEAVARSFCETVGVTLTSVPADQPTGSPTASSPTDTSASTTPTSPAANSPSPTPSPSPSPTGQAETGNAASHGVNAVLALGALGVGALML